MDQDENGLIARTKDTLASIFFRTTKAYNISPRSFILFPLRNKFPDSFRSNHATTYTSQIKHPNQETQIRFLIYAHH